MVKPIPGFEDFQKARRAAEQKKLSEQRAAEMKQMADAAKEKKKELLRTLVLYNPKWYNDGDMILKILVLISFLTTCISLCLYAGNENQALLRNVCIPALVITVITAYLNLVWEKIMDSDAVYNLNARKRYKDMIKLTEPGLSKRKLNRIHKRCGNYALEIMAKNKPLIFENLIDGGLVNANYKTVESILRGHLFEHPEDYEKLIQVFDEKSLPAFILKEYGKTKSR